MSNTPSACDLCRFDFSPAEYIDASWLDTLEHAPSLRAMQRSVRARPHLSRHILRVLLLQPSSDWRLETDPLRLALLAPQRLRRLVLESGLCLTARDLRHVVDGDRVRGLVKALGHDLYSFALRQAPATAESLGLPALPLEDDGADSPESVVIRRGMGVLASVAGGMTHPVRKRMLIKLPHEWFGMFGRDAAIDAITAESLVRYLLEEGHAHDRVEDDGDARARA